MVNLEVGKTYETRNGKIVIIDRVGNEKSTFSCAGYIMKLNKRNLLVRSQWTIWKPNGQYGGYGTHNLDIVKELK